MILLFVIFGHWIADFCLQTHWQASNKSKNWNALARHVSSYSLFMTFWIYLLTLYFHNYEVSPLIIFLYITFMTHFATDAVTSRITSKLYAKGDWHNFFAVIGFDQVVHYATLFFTLHTLEFINLYNH